MTWPPETLTGGRYPAVTPLSPSKLDEAHAKMCWQLCWDDRVGTRFLCALSKNHEGVHMALPSGGFDL